MNCYTISSDLVGIRLGKNNGRPDQKCWHFGKNCTDPIITRKAVKLIYNQAENAIGLIKLNESVSIFIETFQGLTKFNLTTNVTPMCLPQSINDDGTIFNHGEGVSLSGNQNTHSGWPNATILSEDECRNMNVATNKDQFCAGIGKLCIFYQPHCYTARWAKIPIFGALKFDKI